MRHGDIVTLHPTGQDRQLDRIVLTHIIEFPVDPGWVRENIPLVEDALVLDRIADTIFDRPLQHHASLEGFIVVVEARPLSRQHDRAEHGGSIGTHDRRTIPERTFRILQDHGHHLARETNFQRTPRDPRQIVDHRYRLEFVESRNSQIHFLGTWCVNFRGNSSSHPCLVGQTLTYIGFLCYAGKSRSRL